MNKTVAIASARQAPKTAPSDDVSTNITLAKRVRPKINPQSLAQHAAAPAPDPQPKSPDALVGTTRPQSPASERDALANAIAKSRRSPQRCQPPDICSAETTQRGSIRASAA